ncbi:hypothetical protein HZS_7798 [Henneguya salminicola]|nr:hypothetical protein HZS_7798 [Henneguya salminicola]
MVEYHKQPGGSYKSKEVSLYHVERRDANTLLPIMRDNITPRRTLESILYCSSLSLINIPSACN